MRRTGGDHVPLVRELRFCMPHNKAKNKKEKDKGKYEHIK